MNNFKKFVAVLLGVVAQEISCKDHLIDQCSLSVVYVTDSTNIYVRFGTLKLFFCHSFVLFYK